MGQQDFLILRIKKTFMGLTEFRWGHASLLPENPVKSLLTLKTRCIADGGDLIFRIEKKILRVIDPLGIDIFPEIGAQYTGEDPGESKLTDAELLRYGLLGQVFQGMPGNIGDDADGKFPVHISSERRRLQEGKAVAQDRGEDGTNQVRIRILPVAGQAVKLITQSIHDLRNLLRLDDRGLGVIRFQDRFISRNQGQNTVRDIEVGRRTVCGCTVIMYDVREDDGIVSFGKRVYMRPDLHLHAAVYHPDDLYVVMYMERVGEGFVCVGDNEKVIHFILIDHVSITSSEICISAHVF